MKWYKDEGDLIDYDWFCTGERVREFDLKIYYLLLLLSFLYYK